MFRGFTKLYESLLDEIRLWRDAIKRHREELEAEPTAKPPAEAATRSGKGK